MQLLRTVHCVVFNNLCNQHWIGTYFVYYKYMSRNKENVSGYDYVYQPKKYQYKWEILNKLTPKIEFIIFTKDMINLKGFESGL